MWNNERIVMELKIVLMDQMNGIVVNLRPQIKEMFNKICFCFICYFYSRCNWFIILGSSISETTCGTIRWYRNEWLWYIEFQIFFFFLENIKKITKSLFTSIFWFLVWAQNNYTCLCRGDELHCQNMQLTALPTKLPDDGISLL